MNNYAIETVQSLFENMLNVPQSELGTTVMRFRCYALPRGSEKPR